MTIERVMPDFHQVALSLLNHRFEDKLTNAATIIAQVFEQGRALGKEEALEANQWWVEYDNSLPLDPWDVIPRGNSIERAFGVEDAQILAEGWYPYVTSGSGLEGLIPQEPVRLDEEDYNAFVDALNSDPQPNEALKLLFKNKNPWKDANGNKK